MDDRELSSRIKALAKSLNSEPATTVVKLLEDLKKDTAPTEEQLRVRPGRTGTPPASDGCQTHKLFRSPRRPVSQ